MALTDPRVVKVNKRTQLAYYTKFIPHDRVRIGTIVADVKDPHLNSPYQSIIGNDTYDHLVYAVPYAAISVAETMQTKVDWKLAIKMMLDLENSRQNDLERSLVAEEYVTEEILDRDKLMSTLKGNANFEQWIIDKDEQIKSHRVYMAVGLVRTRNAKVNLKQRFGLAHVAAMQVPAGSIGLAVAGAPTFTSGDGMGDISLSRHKQDVRSVEATGLQAFPNAGGDAPYQVTTIRWASVYGPSLTNSRGSRGTHNIEAKPMDGYHLDSETRQFSNNDINDMGSDKVCDGAIEMIIV